MNLFVLYPHIYVKEIDNNVLFYDTLKGKHIKLSLEKNRRIFFYSNSIIDAETTYQPYIIELLRLNFGYKLTAHSLPVCTNVFSFTTSREKLHTVLQYKDGRSIFDSITKLSIFIDNTNVKFDNEIIYSILGFPKSSVNDLSNLDFFINTYKFNGLEQIEVVSSMTPRVRNYIKSLCDKGVLVTFKTVVNNIEYLPEIISFAKNNKDIPTKLYLSLNIAENIKVQDIENLSIIPFSSSLKEILESSFNNVYPLIYDKQRHQDLIEAIKISEEDILSRKLSTADIRLNHVLNRQFYGNITLYNGYVFSKSQKIGTFVDFRNSFNSWFYEDDNNWFLSRSKYRKCHKCLFVDLCPSISIMEETGVLDYPCKL